MTFWSWLVSAILEPLASAILQGVKDRRAEENLITLGQSLEQVKELNEELSRTKEVSKTSDYIRTLGDDALDELLLRRKSSREN